MSWWFCLEHQRVEGEDGCAHAQRLGPYASQQEAEHALDKARDRNQAWDAEDAEND